MLLQLPEFDHPAGGHAAAAAVAARLPRPGAGALAVGPGLSRGAGAARLVHDLCAAAELPLLLDADALHALAGAGERLIARRPSPAVLTPHPGELSRLIGLDTERVQADRVGAARACARRFTVVVLKGARTVVAQPDGPTWVNPTGSPAMAAAGMGDVLSGVIAAHLARGMAPLAAALLGAYLHGSAGEHAATDRGPWGVLAAEVADRIPAAVNRIISDDAPADADLTLLIP
jgi:NAD(P)H-hydrate epimerase